MTAEPKAALKYKSSSDTHGQSEVEKCWSTVLQAGCACLNKSLFTMAEGKEFTEMWFILTSEVKINQNKIEKRF